MTLKTDSRQEQPSVSCILEPEELTALVDTFDPEEQQLLLHWLLGWMPGDSSFWQGLQNGIVHLIYQKMKEEK